MSDIDWVGVIEYCQGAAADGKLVTNLFTKERQVDCPRDYEGGETEWPSKGEVFRHFCENPAAWELLRRGYEWRSFELYDKIASCRSRVESGSLEPRQAKVIIDACFQELRLTSAEALRERREAEKAVQAAKPTKAAQRAAEKAQAANPENSIAARLARAQVQEAVDEADKVHTPKRKPRPKPATEWSQ